VDIRADLCRPEAYGRGAPARIDLVETHISWVFLVDDEVFKVKKPVDLGFLDFRTLEKRRAACDAEVLLNRRLAPGVYRGVVAVRLGPNGRCRLGDGEDGPIVDWAVHMVRLPDAWRADALLARGALKGQDIDLLAERLAAFHAAARADTEVARFGWPDVILRNIEENFDQTRDFAGAYLSVAEGEEIAAWQTAFVRRHRPLLVGRAGAGRVREGHGDLRLEHVYLPPSGDPAIIDCIEFNERFRFADVCADVAFLSMDLAVNRRVDLAERLLARYARATNDYDLYALVDFYQSYRAYVRAKIAAFVANDPRFGEEARGRAAHEARRHFLLSLSERRPPIASPIVIAVGGVIASGKSTVAERAAAELNAPIIDTDRTRKAMLGMAATRPVYEAAWRGAYDPAFSARVYEEVFRRAGVVLASGRPVILDASFHQRATREAARALARRYGARFQFVECQVDPAVCRSRLAARRGGVSDGRLEIFDAFVARVEPVVELPRGEHLVLDTSRPLDESVEDLRRHIGPWPPGFVG
jgi:uncharacterized protein